MHGGKFMSRHVFICDDKVDRNFTILLSFRNVWGPSGYVLASWLVPKRLYRPSNDQLCFDKKKGLTTRRIIVVSFSAIQIIQKSHLELIYALFHFFFLFSNFQMHNRLSWRHNTPSWRHNRLYGAGDCMPPLYMPQSLMPPLYMSQSLMLPIVLMYDDHAWWS